MDSLLNLLIGDLTVQNDLIVAARMIVIMFALEVFASVVSLLGGFKR